MLAASLTLAVALTGAFDPEIDTQLKPQAGLSLGIGFERLSSDFGAMLRVGSPWFLDGHLSFALVGGIAFHPDFRSLPQGARENDFGAWATYGRTRAVGEFALPIAAGAGRIYVAAGPSFVFLPSDLSSTRVGVGIYGAAGLEVFAGDGYRTYPISFYAEIGGVAHNASQDVDSRTGGPEDDLAVDRPIATGFAMFGGLRFYLWR